MTLNEIRAARMYLKGEASLEQIGHHCRLTAQDVLHAVSVYLRQKRGQDTECANCRWRSGDRPCVLPRCLGRVLP